MSEVCNCNSIKPEPILEKLTKDNFNEIFYNTRLILNRKHLTIYHIDHIGKMKTEDGSWVECVSYYPNHNYDVHYTRSINSVIKNFIPIVLEGYQTRLLDEKDSLDYNIFKLENFINKNPKFQELDGKDKELMEKQLSAMSIYHAFLKQRVDKMLKQKIEDYDALPSTGEEVKANVAEPANVL